MNPQAEEFDWNRIKNDKIIKIKKLDTINYQRETDPGKQNSTIINRNIL